MTYLAALIEFGSIPNGKKFTAVVAGCMKLASSAFETISFICAFEANWSRVINSLLLLISFGTNIRRNSIESKSFVPRSCSQSQWSLVLLFCLLFSSSSSLFSILFIFFDLHQINPFHQFILHFIPLYLFYLSFLLLFLSIFTFKFQNHFLDILRNMPKDIHHFLLALTCLFRIRSHVLVNYAIKARIPCCSLHFCAANDAFFHFVADQLGQAASAHSVGAGLDTDWVDHYLEAVRAGDLLFYGVYKSLVFLIDFFYLGMTSQSQQMIPSKISQKDQFESYSFLHWNSETRKQPNLALVLNLHLYALIHLLILDKGAIRASISQKNLDPLGLNQAMLPTKSFLADHNMTIRIPSNDDPPFFQSMSIHASTQGNKFAPYRSAILHQNLLQPSCESLNNMPSYAFAQIQKELVLLISLFGLFFNECFSPCALFIQIELFQFYMLVNFSYLSPPKKALRKQFSRKIGFYEASYIHETINGKNIRRIFAKCQYEQYQRDAVEKLKDYLKKKAPNMHYTDELLLKFSYEGNFLLSDVTEKVKMYDEWHQNELIVNLTKSGRQILQHGQIYSYGRDEDYCPILIIKPSKFDLKKYQPIHYLNAISNLLQPIEKHMLISGTIQKWNIIIDFQSKKLTIDTQTLTKSLSKVAYAYPYRLKRIFYVNLHSSSEAIVKQLEQFKKSVDCDAEGLIVKSFDEFDRYVNIDQREKKYGGSQYNLNEFWPIHTTNKHEESESVFDQTEYQSVANDMGFFEEPKPAFCDLSNSGCIIY